jgi:phosphotransferase system HPr (HPr) family protein
VSAAAEKKVRIQNDLGLHLRAAGALVQVASRFKSEIRIKRGSTEANAKSIMSVLSLAAGKGVELTLIAEGDDAEEAVTSLVVLIEGGFKHP